jgi:hypothetical protein
MQLRMCPVVAVLLSLVKCRIWMVVLISGTQGVTAIRIRTHVIGPRVHTKSILGWVDDPAVRQGFWRGGPLLGIKDVEVGGCRSQKLCVILGFGLDLIDGVIGILITVWRLWLWLVLVMERAPNVCGKPAGDLKGCA